MSLGIRDDHGFTLVEMLVLLTIVGLLAAVAMSNLSIRPAFVDRAKLRGGLEAAVARARQQALQTGRPVAIELSVPDVKKVRFTPALGSGQTMAYPDGSTTGGLLMLKDKPLYVLDWMTGRVSDADTNRSRTD
jgi:prepilin-type N-terminal cleavage/methylation domain-containing protein